MKFVKYHSLTNSFKGDSIDYIKLNHADELKDVAWNVFEKIHGANFSIWLDGKEIKFAKRSGFIEPNDKFFNFKPMAEKNINKFIAAQQLLGKPIVIYGELFGGKFNGKTHGAVQKEVEYCLDIDFAPFDIATINEDDTITYLDETELNDLLFTVGLTPAPYIGEYQSLDEALKAPNKFLSMVSLRYGLTTQGGNFAEGIVIKPTKPLFMKTGERIIFKSKNDLFKESKSVEVDSSVNEEFMVFFNLFRTHITKARLNSVVSKLGPEPAYKDLFTEFVKDCLDECDLIVYNNFSDSQKRLLTKLSASQIWPLIKEYKQAA